VKFIQRCVEVEAIQWTGRNINQICEFLRDTDWDRITVTRNGPEHDLELYNRKSAAWIKIVYPSDWLVKETDQQVVAMADIHFTRRYQKEEAASV